MRCKKCHKYSPGYYCSHCSRTKSGGTKPLDVALKKLAQGINEVMIDECKHIPDDVWEKLNTYLKEKHENQNDKTDSLPEDSESDQGSESKD